ncbi:MAG: DNA recombination protein RmuC [Ruminococcus sp.]|nr:DNA recombination protein RmuC [Ruminococcus sp.]
MEYIILACVLVLIALCCVILVKFNGVGRSGGSDEEIAKLSEQLFNANKRTLDEQSRLRTELSSTVTASVSHLGDSLRDEQFKQSKSLEARIKAVEGELDKIRLETLGTLEKIRVDNNVSMEKIRSENRESLDKINGTVNEKLQKTLDDKISRSFEAVNKRLAEVYEGLGEMKNVASGVSDLKNVLSNVKTRGIMGEIQLASILSEILAPEQYDEQIPVSPKAKERVDFAVKLPGTGDGDGVLLPIDSKFPGDSYANLLEAYENGDSEEIKRRRSLLISELKSCAKSIRDKYIAPPYTTDFAIMFLPFEGLYAEAVNLGMVEELQRLYKVNIAGPSTTAAMLNSLQMGFRTLAIQKKSGEVWKVLEEAKKEFSQFESVLDKTRDRLRQADEELDKLIGTRTRAINRKLKDVAMIETEQIGGENNEI